MESSYDRIVSADLFAEKLVEDLGLALESHLSIQEQLMDYYPHIYMHEEARSTSPLHGVPQRRDAYFDQVEYHNWSAYPH
ncbi:SWI-SNF complex subunit (Snf5) [Penicillium malachiteum]|uniref:SWI-SNF complex subunit (Snf5) n=1 Tax=Penicillium malachiteum TaxID=1324776 RepID=A0AAD6MSQ7_9EURO|nr:SWI-SNF complex subunit (Snf5) [Penicillium malachiteum]